MRTLRRTRIYNHLREACTIRLAKSRRMYGTRKVKVKFARNTWDDQLKGIGVSSVPGTFDRNEPRERSRMAPPSPLPPTPASPQAADFDFDEEEMGQMKEDEFTRHAREQTKAQLASITGRMFQVLNDFEDDGGHEKGYLDIDDQLDSIQNTELKANLQLMIADYKDICVEREELLHSLADWFDEGHIDDILEDMKHRRKSVAADPEGVRKSLMEGKIASQKLKAINDQIDSAMDQGLPVSHLEEKKAELEKEVMKSAKFMENDKQGQATNHDTQEDVSAKVKDSWKFAAVEIYNLINQVRENGIDDVHEMESKMRELLASMNQQSDIIDKLSKDLQYQRQLAAFSDETTSQLSGDNSLLKDEVEMLRGQLMEANDTIVSLRSDIKLKTKEAERKGKSRQAEKCASKDKRALDTEMAKFELKVAQLTDENTNLQQENQDLLMACERLERDLEVAKELFDEEVAGHKAELDLLCSTIERNQSTSKQANTKITNVTSPKTDDSLDARSSLHSNSAIDSSGSLHEVTRRVSTTSKTITATEAERKISAKSKTVTTTATERRASQFHQTLHHNQDHLFAKLADKDHQLKSAKQELAETRELMQDMESELERLKRENAELVKLQERSAALIKQASTCLQISNERSADKTSQQSMIRISQPATVSGPPSALQSTTKTEAVHTITQATLTKAISHNSSHTMASQPPIESKTDEITQEQETSAVLEKPVRKSSGNTWSVLNSIDNGGRLFGMPTERSAAEKEADSLQLVMELIEKVNVQQSDFATADSKALQQIHTELTKVSQIVRKFLEYSTTLINDEAEVVSHAVDSLMKQLPNDEKPVLDGPIPPPGEKPNRLQQQRLSLADTSVEEQRRMKEKAVHFADQAIEVLKAGERMLTTKINTQQKRLNTVLHAMEDHRRRQSQFFKFEAPDSVGLALEAHGVSRHNMAANQQTQRKEQSSDHNRERLARLRRYATTGKSNANANLFLAYMKAGRYTNSIAGFGGAFPNFSEKSDNVDGGMSIGIHGYGGGDVRSRRTMDATPRPSALANSLQINNTRPEGQLSLRFGSNMRGTNYQQQHQPTGGDGTDRTIGSKPRKKAGKLYKPFQASAGNSYVFPTRRENWQGRQGATGGQRAAHSNAAAQMGRRWESSAYNQQDYGGQDAGSREHKTPGATFYDLLKHNTRAARTQQQTQLGGFLGLKLPPI